MPHVLPRPHKPRRQAGRLSPVRAPASARGAHLLISNQVFFR